MKKNNGPSPTAKVWRYQMRLLCNDGAVRDFDSVLLTKSQAVAEQVQWTTNGQKDVRVVLDAAAVKALAAPKTATPTR